MDPTVAIIIPFRREDRLLARCLEGCARLAAPSCEVVLCGETAPSRPRPGVRFVEARGSISRKRNAGLRALRPGTRFVAFLDSDAYPRPDWLAQATRLLQDGRYAAVTGPHLTPPDSGFAGRCSGSLLGSPLVLGPFARAYREDTPAHETEKGATCNLIVGKETVQRAGGFDETLLTAEDFKFCRDLRERAGARILFSPDVVVFHYRRPLGWPLLKQWLNYGLRSSEAGRFASPQDRTFFMCPAALLGLHGIGVGTALLSRACAVSYASLCLLWAALALAGACRLGGSWKERLACWPAMMGLPLAIGLGTWLGFLGLSGRWIDSESSLP